MKAVAISSLIALTMAQSSIKKRSMLADSEVQRLESACSNMDSGELSGPAQVLCSQTGSDALRSYVQGLDQQKMLSAYTKNECEGGNCQTGTLNLEALFGYGCWCFFGRIDSALGRGPPVDAYDATCQKLSLCYRCIFVDADTDGDDDCDPFTQLFTATFSLGGSGGGVSNSTSSCQTDNQSNCAWRTCSCAMTMISSFFNLSFDIDNVYDQNLVHANGFDYNLECPEQGRAVDRRCCGFYPNRRTYDHGDGTTRDCCHERTIYNPLRHVCCADGTHVGIGHNCE